ncbi:ladderlectin-like [Stigmatopora argus]
MAFALSSLFLILAISGLLPGVCPFPLNHWKKIRCPSGWTQLDCQCYKFKSTPANFIDAELDCINEDGNLASIPSMVANIVVQEILRAGWASTGWIGLHDAIQNKDFIWTDGSFTDFRNFGVSEPDESGPCVQMDMMTGEWGDVDCSTDTNQYVCVMDLCHGSSSAVPDPCPM